MAQRDVISLEIVDVKSAALTTAIEATDKDNQMYVIPLGGIPAQVMILEVDAQT